MHGCFLQLLYKPNAQAACELRPQGGQSADLSQCVCLKVGGFYGAQLEQHAKRYKFCTTGKIRTSVVEFHAPKVGTGREIFSA